MDVRTLCLGILTRGDATGYEIKKLVEDEGYEHFVEASFGSIYPALSRLTEEGLVSVRDETQEKRPDRKVYSIAAAGRSAFLASLMRPLPEDRHRSSFVFAMLFSHLLPQERVATLIDAYIGQSEAKLAQLTQQREGPLSKGEEFVLGLGRTIYQASLNFIRAHRADVEKRAAEAAE